MFQIPAQITKVTTLKDGSTQMVIECQELPPSEMAEVFTLRGDLGWFVFSANALSEKDIPKEEAPELNQKSQSQRLRSVLYLYWEKCTKKNPDFKRFYEQWYEKKINEVKELLPDK
jgi:hypothetical protein